MDFAGKKNFIVFVHILRIQTAIWDTNNKFIYKNVSQNQNSSNGCIHNVWIYIHLLRDETIINNLHNLLCIYIYNIPNNFYWQGEYSCNWKI